MDLTERIYLLTDSFPKTETYGLTSQIRRSAVSVPSNLAEGHARDSTKEFLHFIAFGSICELETQILLSNRLKYISNDDVGKISDYHSHNTERLDVEGTKKLLLKLDTIRTDLGL